ncbi:helix-turn-helix transcriptional regulator [uncultured Subdoligranulum sp.]|uniref:helix-turn-helix domain-containing protein n=1 Tax=uncultured Subdoligranulum sp. TaxID=512298 RepID=UPI0025EF1690|nr:helix-turn-helix transcriptional regulator [uncultured Subdoligranulum sp.]
MPYPNINAERVRNGMTMETLATNLGVTRKTVYNWMVHGNIPQTKLEAMSEMFHCSIEYLLQGKD